jgi:hypothetical protein
MSWEPLIAQPENGSESEQTIRLRLIWRGEFYTNCRRSREYPFLRICATVLMASKLSSKRLQFNSLP